MLLVYVILAIFHIDNILGYATVPKDLSNKWRRIRRDETSVAGYELPLGHNPLPAYTPESLEPVFPMVHSFNNGFMYQSPTNLAIMGHANVPIMNWGLWDLHADIAPQTSNTNMQFGYLTSPLNLLNFSPQEIDTLYHDPRIKAQRRDATPVSVNDLPGTDDYLLYGGRRFKPLSCRPPLCNPNVHSFDTGLQFQQGIDFQLPGKLDFPIPAKTPWEPSYRYNLNGYGWFGVQPNAVQYGHDITGIDPRTTAFRPSANPGNPFALKRLLSPEPKNTIPFRQIPLNGRNIFQND